jgi:ADP-L-glycero-D-manno-heptose 6-epimerase
MKNNLVITGGFGFIGSNMIRHLNSKGITPYVIEKMDNVGQKWRNVRGLSFDLVDSIPEYLTNVTIVHIGADVDTTSPMTAELWRNNVDYTIALWEQARERCLTPPRLIYASSGAIYGNEEKNFTERVDGMMPENAYAFTKWQLDSLLKDKPNVYGLRFFNVYDTEGREAHKGNMKSLISRALDIKDGVFEIFKTGREDIKDGEQARDFVHVDDICSTIWYFIETPDNTGGLFNVGTGEATSFNEIADILGLKKNYIDMPAHLRAQYQFFTRAKIDKLRAHGYTAPFMTVREGIERSRLK